MIKEIIKSILCKHNYKLVRTIHGDEIINMGYARSEWKCSKCNHITYGMYLDRIKWIFKNQDY